MSHLERSATNLERFAIKLKFLTSVRATGFPGWRAISESLRLEGNVTIARNLREFYDQTFSRFHRHIEFCDLGFGTADSGYRPDSAASCSAHHIRSAGYDNLPCSDWRPVGNGTGHASTRTQHACWKSQHDAADESNRPTDPNHD